MALSRESALGFVQRFEVAGGLVRAYLRRPGDAARLQVAGRFLGRVTRRGSSWMNRLASAAQTILRGFGFGVALGPIALAVAMIAERLADRGEVVVVGYIMVAVGFFASLNLVVLTAAIAWLLERTVFLHLPFDRRGRPRGSAAEGGAGPASSPGAFTRGGAEGKRERPTQERRGRVIRLELPRGVARRGRRPQLGQAIWTDRWFLSRQNPVRVADGDHFAIALDAGPGEAGAGMTLVVEVDAPPYLFDVPTRIDASRMPTALRDLSGLPPGTVGDVVWLREGDEVVVRYGGAEREVERADHISTVSGPRALPSAGVGPYRGRRHARISMVTSSIERPVEVQVLERRGEDSLSLVS